jgi:hypothetical protein
MSSFHSDAFGGPSSSQWTWMQTHKDHPPTWVYTPREIGFSRARRISEAMRSTMLTTDLRSVASVPSISVASISVPSVPSSGSPAPASQSSHSPSEQASQTSASLSYHGKTLESATDWADAVRTALVKDSKGYPDRLSGYLTSTRAIAELAGTYSLRLASFFYQELVHAAATLGRKNADYTEQLRILYYPEEPLPDYLHYVACTRELISIEEEIVREQRNQTQRRILAMTRVLRSGESRRRSMHYLMEKLMPFLYLPDGYASECNRDRRSSVSNPMIIRGAVEYISASSPANSTKLDAKDLNSSDTSLSLAPPGLRKQAAPNLNHYRFAATCGSGGGADEMSSRGCTH